MKTRKLQLNKWRTLAGIGVVMGVASTAAAQCPIGNVSPSVPGADAGFGFSAAIDGDYAILGAPWDDVNGQINAGSVDLFRRAGTNWIHDGRITSPSVFGYDTFGMTVDIDGLMAVVGEPSHDVIGANSVGQAYLYYRNASGQWVYGTTFASGLVNNASIGRFGDALSLEDEYLLIGMPGGPSATVGSNAKPGRAFLYKRTFGYANWTLEFGFNSPWEMDGIEYGAAVAMQQHSLRERTVAVIGVPNYGPGRVHVHTKPASGTNWSSYSTLAPSAQAGSMFGCAVAVSGDLLVVGAKGYDVNGQSDVGVVYVFRRQPGTTTWSQVDVIANPMPNAGSEFGRRVSIDGDQILASSKSRAWVFRRAVGDQWEPEWMLRGTGNSSVGAVDMSGEHILIGSNTYTMSESLPGTGIGTMYKFTDSQGSNTCEYAPLIDSDWVTGCTHTATRDGAAACEGAGQGADVWYRWIAPCDGTLTLSTQYSDFDTVLSVHLLCPSTEGSVMLACNDNAAPGEVTSSLTLDVQGGTWYTIRVAARTVQASGWYLLTLDHTCAPACAADIAPQPSGDGAVNVSDLLMIINNWGMAGTGDIAPPGGDGVVNVSDLLAVINAWGMCP